MSKESLPRDTSVGGDVWLFNKILSVLVGDFGVARSNLDGRAASEPATST